jgi:hypothetical protein
VTSTRISGSRITGEAFATASLRAIEAAIRNAISLESTSWKEPSKRVALTSTIGWPAWGPVSRASRMPMSMGLMYSRGMVPPTILSTNS